MARAIWSGAVSFGLVNVPVKLYSAIKHKDVHFHQFEEGTGARIHNKRVSEKSGREVPYEKIVKGYEVAKGKHVMLDQEDFEALEPEATHTVDIEDFVSLDDIDPIYYERTYYLAPANEGATKAYALLLAAMEEKGRVGIGRMVMRTKQYLAAIRPYDGVLALSTLLFADEVVSKKEIDALPARKPKASPKEVRLAGQIVDSLTSDWDPTRYKDTYRNEVLKLIKKKAKGDEIVAEKPAEKKEDKVVDLLAALEASLEASGRGKRKSA